MTEDDTRPRGRFMLIQLVRISGVTMVLIGLLAMNGRFDLPREAGFVLSALGLIGATVAPLRLARKWKSPPQ